MRIVSLGTLLIRLLMAAAQAADRGNTVEFADLPEAPVIGEIWFVTGTTETCEASGGTDRHCWWDGTSWVPLSEPVPANVPGGFPRIDESTEKIGGDVLPYPSGFATVPSVCGREQEWSFDTTQTGKYRLAICVGGEGENPLTEPYISTLAQICINGADCRTLPDGADGTLNIITGTHMTASIGQAGEVIEVKLNAGGATKSLWIPAATMAVSGTCGGTPGPVTLGPNGPKRTTIVPARDDTCSIEFDWVFHEVDAWNAGTIQVQLIAFSEDNEHGNSLALDFAGQCIRAGDAVLAHSTTGEQAASVTFGDQANDEQMSAPSPAITLNGTCAAQSHIYMRGQVNATTTTLADIADTHVLGVMVLYGTR